MLVLALVATAALYAPTAARGLVNYDDPWLVRDNWIVTNPSWASLHAIWFDLSRESRFVLGAEYLPVRDVSIMLDHVIWGSWYGGFHITNVLIYLAAISLWFAALGELGIDRRVLGVMALIWALHPSHAESVAWISERKGLLGAMFAGATAFSYARFRAGRSARWIWLAVFTTLCAVWSKAPSAFAIAALGGLEVALPVKRVSWKRSLFGLGVLAAVGVVAFLPVLATALRATVIGTDDHAPAGWLEMALGIHGFYLRLGALALRNSPSYEIGTLGPSWIDVAVGALGLLVIVALALASSRGKLRTPPELRAAAMLWLFGWFPASRLVLPMHAVLVSDRYMLLPTLGLALAVGAGVMRIAIPRARRALIGTIVLACALRTLDAQSNWRDNLTLWQRAVTTNPSDSNAWSMYADAVMDAGRMDLAFDVLHVALRHSRSPRLLLRKALLVLQGAPRVDGIRAMREAAVAGEPRAMMNLALLLLEDGKVDEALGWATRGAEALPMHGPAHRALGKVALAAHRPELALDEFASALRFEPTNLANKYNMALALIALRRPEQARAYLEASRSDPSLASRVQVLLDEMSR